MLLEQRLLSPAELPLYCEHCVKGAPVHVHAVQYRSIVTPRLSAPEIHCCKSACIRLPHQVSLKPASLKLKSPQVGSAALVYVQPSQDFSMPEDPAKPIIMIGPGTGIAPFRYITAFGRKAACPPPPVSPSRLPPPPSAPDCFHIYCRHMHEMRLSTCKA